MNQPSPPSASKEERARRRREELERRRTGRLSDDALADLATFNRNVPALSTAEAADDAGPATLNDYCVAQVLQRYVGRVSQFHTHGELPPLASDCCQTFACLLASSLCALSSASELAALRREVLDYVTYTAAWAHQLSAPRWRDRRAGKTRPTVADVRQHLRLPEVFGVALRPEGFVPVFYNQRDVAAAMVAALIAEGAPSTATPGPGSAKRPREGDAGPTAGDDGPGPVRGYVVVSGDYAFGVAAVPLRAEPSPAEEGVWPAGAPLGWSLCLVDSHGELPWSLHRASLSTVQVRSAAFQEWCDARRRLPCDGRPPLPPNAGDAEGHLSAREGLRHFTAILFALLEHCKTHYPQRRPSATAAPVTLDLDSGSDGVTEGPPPPTAAPVLGEYQRVTRSLAAQLAPEAGPVPYMSWVPLEAGPRAATVGDIVRHLHEGVLRPLLRRTDACDELRRLGAQGLRGPWPPMGAGTMDPLEV